MRAQTELPALGLSFLLLTGVTVFGVVAADGALRAADRSALERQAAVDLSDRLVAADAHLTTRANALNATALDGLNGTVLREKYGLSERVDGRVTLAGDRIASTGSVDGGTTIERLVLVERQTRQTVVPSFTGGNAVTLPRRTVAATLHIDPRPNTTVAGVRAGDRVVLYNRTGLAGTHQLSLPMLRTVQLRFTATRPLQSGTVRITYRPVETKRVELEVTVDGPA